MPTSHAARSDFVDVAVNCIHALTVFPPSMAVRVSVLLAFCSKFLSGYDWRLRS
ncbi:hypothetical protein [Shewanella sediminis]|uniref:hypothetical protein n=1 Tax=Shewanella sediminis TaxID=271097 RepID=UPI00167F4509|nr:hypothetical protein [Shewanella sediminis]